MVGHSVAKKSVHGAASGGERSVPAPAEPAAFSLRAKGIIFLAVALAAVAFASFALVSHVLLGTFGALQKEATLERIATVINQLDQVVRQQRNALLDNALWDETFDSFAGDPADYLKRNYDPLTGSAGQNAILLFDARRDPLAQVFIGQDGTVENQPPQYLDVDAARQSGLLAAEAVGSAITATPDGLLVLSAHPVMRTDGTGPSPGWLAYGLNLGDEWFDEVRRITGVTVSTSFPPQAFAGAGMRQAETFRMEALGECRVFYPPGGIGQDGITVYVDFPNTIGRVAAEFRLVLPSTVLAAAHELRDHIFLIALAGYAAALVAAILAFEVFIVQKISRLAREFRDLASGRVDAPVPDASDEFGQLARSAKMLVDSLRRGRTEAESGRQVLESILDTLPYGITAFRALRDKKGVLLDFVMVQTNKAAGLIANRRREDMLGRRLLELFPAAFTEGIFRRQAHVVETRQPVDFEILYNHEGINSSLHIAIEPWNDGFVSAFREIAAPAAPDATESETADAPPPRDVLPATPRKQDVPEVPDPICAEDFAGLKILGVDDVATNVRLLAGILKTIGGTHSFATNGLEAVDLAGETAFDIIFMDVLMPVCDGVEATLRIRKLERAAPGRRPSYIVALTADAYEQNRARCMAAGMDEFQTKPLRVEAIRAAIMRGARRPPDAK